MNEDDPFDLLDVIGEFPLAAGAFAEMRRYVKAVAQFSDHVGSQTVVRLGAQLRRVRDPVSEAELEYEIEVARRDAETTIPRVIWGSVLVAIYATYETGVRNALMFWNEKVAGSARFNSRQEGGFLKSASEYARSEIGVELFTDEGTREIVYELRTLRNSFAHATGEMPQRKGELHRALLSAQSRGIEVTVVEGAWIASPRCAVRYLLFVERTYKQFADKVIERYLVARRGGPTSASS